MAMITLITLIIMKVTREMSAIWYGNVNDNYSKNMIISITLKRWSW